MVQHRKICDTDLKMYFLVPLECIVCLLLVYYSKVINSAELFICTKQIICGYLGFELFIFFLSFSCWCCPVRVVVIQMCSICFLVNPFDTKSDVPLVHPSFVRPFSLRRRFVCCCSSSASAPEADGKIPAGNSGAGAKLSAASASIACSTGWIWETKLIWGVRSS